MLLDNFHGAWGIPDALPIEGIIARNAIPAVRVCKVVPTDLAVWR